jgi:hypothetical protein
VIVALALLCYLPGKTYRRAGREMAQSIDVRSTSEYKTSVWIGQNMQDRRVFVPGSDYLWLNAFTDTPQLEGGFDQGVTNPLVQDVHYQMYMGEVPPNGGELTILWLKAFGVHAVVVSGPRSTEVYKPFRNWKKFEGLLPVLWRDGDDVRPAMQLAPVSVECVLLEEIAQAANPSGGLRSSGPLAPLGTQRISRR